MGNTKKGRRSSMAALERRKKILAVLAQRRKVSCDELANEFGVSTRTIKNDVLELSLHHPIETVTGLGGGISMMDGYYPDVIRMTVEMTELLKRCRETLDGHDREVMDSILNQFGAR